MELPVGSIREWGEENRRRYNYNFILVISSNEPSMTAIKLMDCLDEVGLGDPVVCRGNFPFDVFLGGDDGAVWNGQVVLEGPTSAQRDVVLVVLDDSVCVFLAMNGGDLPGLTVEGCRDLGGNGDDLESTVTSRVHATNTGDGRGPEGVESVLDHDFKTPATFIPSRCIFSARHDQN